MKYRMLLLATSILGCASNQETKPISIDAKPTYVRHLVSQNDLLYTYTVTGDGPTGYALAEADAEKTCRSKWNKGAVQKTQPSCGVYNSSKMNCAVTFRCM